MKEDNGMRAVFIMLVLFLCTLAQTSASVLIVTKKGESFWATHARQEGDMVRYIDRNTGEEKTIAVIKLDGVIPVVRRGKQYKPEEIQKYVDRTKKIRAKHPMLIGQLNPILQEWEAMQKPSEELAEKIDQLVDEFQNSEKDTKTYQEITLNLGMLRYKDVQGRYTSRIDKVLDDMKNGYLSVNLKRLELMVNAGKTAIDNFVRIKRLARELSQAANVSQNEKIEGLLTKSRQLTFEANCRYANSSFMSSRSISAYLRSRDILFMVRNEVAEADEQKARVDRYISALVEQISKAQPAYSFEFNGYPLSKDDHEVLNRSRAFSTKVRFSDITVDEQCLVIPLRAPGSIRLGQPFALPLRLVFNRAQPRNRVFGIVVLLYRGDGGMHSHTVKLPPLQIKDGHSEIVFREDFSVLEEDFVLGGDVYGNSYLYAYLSYLEEGEDSYDEKWVAISSAYRFRIKP